MAQDIRSAFVALFGEENAPAVPTTKGEYLALNLMQRAAIEKARPEYVESLCASPESLPAGVSLRYSQGTLQPADIPVLRAHGMPATADRLQREANDATVRELVARTEQMRQQHQENEANR